MSTEGVTAPPSLLGQLWADRMATMSTADAVTDLQARFTTILSSALTDEPAPGSAETELVRDDEAALTCLMRDAQRVLSGKRVYS